MNIGDGNQIVGWRFASVSSKAPSVVKLAAQPASALDQIPAQEIKRDDKHDQHAEGRRQRNIVNSEEAVAEAADHIDDRIEMLQPLPEGRQQGQGIKNTAKVGQRRQHEGRNKADIVKGFSKHRVQQAGQRE